MYGTRDAAAAWEREWTKTLNSVGFKSGVSNPALLHCETLDASMVVHGDDFITLGNIEALSEVVRATWILPHEIAVLCRTPGSRLAMRTSDGHIRAQRHHIRLADIV